MSSKPTNRRISPHQHASYLENADNTPSWNEYKDSEDTTSALPEGYQPTDSHKANYLELYPEIKTLGKGYGYAKYYTEPAGHVYSLWTVTSPPVQKCSPSAMPSTSSTMVARAIT